MFHIMSSSSPVGSSIFSAFALLVISLIVLLILRYYLPLRTTPAFYLVPIFFALWLPSIVVILVPIDLASSAATDDEATKGIWLPERLILVSWRIIYWLTFALTWFILPILAEYSDAGYREPQDKLKYSLRENIRFLAMCFAVGLVGLIYVFYSYKPSTNSLKATVMALAYCWGLVLAIYLMGHGLVSIPRQLIRKASVSGRLRRLQASAPRVYERMEDALTALEEIEVQVTELSRRKTGSAATYADWIEELSDIANVPESLPRSTIPSTQSSSKLVPAVITERYLADLTRKLNRAKQKRSQHVDQWHRLVKEASDTQAILDSAASKKLDFGEASAYESLWEKTKILSPYNRYILHYHVLPYAQVALGAGLAAASACILWSELARVSFPKLSVIRLSVIHHWVGDKAQVGFAGQCISAFWICYMCTAALTSMTEVKVWRGRALVKRNTAHESAFWYALQVAKLSIPLSYNFLTFLTTDVYEETIFYDFLGKAIDLTPVSHYFDDLFPVLVLFPVLATLFGLYGRVKRIFVGWDIVEDDEGNITGYGTGNWREGRDLIERELGGNSVLRRREAAFSRLAAAANRSGSSAPILTIPAGVGGSRSPTQSSPVRGGAAGGAGHTARQTQPFIDDPPEDENIFQIIGHRMKNTIDTIETPSWFQGIGNGIKKPKWMNNDGGQQQPSDGQSSSTTTDFRRWFGGDGGIRLG